MRERFVEMNVDSIKALTLGRYIGPEGKLDVRQCPLLSIPGSCGMSVAFKVM